MAALKIEVFYRSGDDLIAVDPARWESFVSGQAPLVDAGDGRGKVDLLLVTSRDGVCDLLEPVSVHVDGNGYLQRVHLRFDSLPRQPGVLDARGAFLGRYLRHANHWVVSERQIAKALAHLRAH
jgi:hypothetical protein